MDFGEILANSYCTSHNFPAMRNFISAMFLACVLSLCPVGPASAGPLEDGARAYDRGDFQTALRLIRPLAEQGDVTAQYNLGTMYYRGDGVPQDYKEAAKWYRKAAEQGYAVAESDLGAMYTDGRGVPRDYAVAAEWYGRAARRGHANAQYNLGNSYYLGKGVPQDFAVAVQWYRRAAEQGVAEAQFDLGVSYVKGLGVHQDYAVAHKWLNLAASRFATSEAKLRDMAVKFREAIARRMTPAQIAEAQRMAREWKPKQE
jgi:hypothetical protein